MEIETPQRNPSPNITGNRAIHREINLRKSAQSVDPFLLGQASPKGGVCPQIAQIFTDFRGMAVGNASWDEGESLGRMGRGNWLPTFVMLTSPKAFVDVIPSHR